VGEQSNAYRILLRYDRKSRHRRIKKQRRYERLAATSQFLSTHGKSVRTVGGPPRPSSNCEGGTGHDHPETTSGCPTRVDSLSLFPLHASPPTQQVDAGPSRAGVARTLSHQREIFNWNHRLRYRVSFGPWSLGSFPARILLLFPTVSRSWSWVFSSLFPTVCRDPVSWSFSSFFNGLSGLCFVFVFLFFACFFF
jgi:hypothetical protein